MDLPVLDDLKEGYVHHLNFYWSIADVRDCLQTLAEEMIVTEL